MRRTYNKLIRDRIPEIIRADGKRCEVEVMGHEAYREALRAKILEEAEEVATAGDGQLGEEVADLLEVLDALCAVYGLDPDAVRQTQQRRRMERGAFERRLRLLRVE